MTTKTYIKQVFANTDYTPVMVTEMQVVTDPVTLAQTSIAVQRAEPLNPEDLATAQNNLNYRRAVVVAEHLSALGLSTSVGLDNITLMLNGGSTLTQVEE